MTSRPKRLRIRGTVGGSETFFPLGDGRNRVGRAEENEIVIAEHGVSRLHASFEVRDGLAEVVDLGAKNGVVVAGRRVDRARLSPGEQVTLGSVTFTLEEIDAADDALGIELADPSPPPPSLRETAPQKTTSFASSGVASLQAVRLIERFVVQSGSGLAPALAELREGLGAKATALLEHRADERTILASAGPLDEASHGARIVELVRAAAGRATADAPGTASAADHPVSACAAGDAGDAGGLALVVLEPASQPHELEPLLRTVLQIAMRLDGSLPDPPRSRPATTDLVFPEGHVPGRSPAMLALYERMRALGQGDLPVLLAGETGVGKEHLAHCLHLSSSRRGGPFVAINCAAIPAELLEAEMFGVSRGAATGVSERKGKFELAAGGTLLLDEVGEMPLELQAKLLRALQEKEIQPLGGSAVSVDIRVVAASNADLLRNAEEGRFRRDLYYRIAGYVLTVPPLRQRREDLPLLIEAFVRRFSAEVGKAVRGVSVRALDSLSSYRWPGNVRELAHEIERLVYACPDGRAIDSTMLSPQIGADAPSDEIPIDGDSLELEKHVATLEARLIRVALDRSGGNRSQAARLLGISRNGLALKLERLGIKDQ